MAALRSDNDRPESFEIPLSFHMIGECRTSTVLLMKYIRDPHPVSGCMVRTGCLIRTNGPYFPERSVAARRGRSSSGSPVQRGSPARIAAEWDARYVVLRNPWI